MQLASSFHYGSPMLRADLPLSDDQIRRVAPSIFADGKHESRSERYTYIPTIDVLRGLRSMPTSLNKKGSRVVIYPADHRPAHVHVIGADFEVVFALNCPDGPVKLCNIGAGKVSKTRIEGSVKLT